MPRNKGDEDDQVEVNLIPAMNLFCALIPFLLFTASFFQIGMINASVPLQTSGEENDVASGSEAVTLSIQITKDGYMVTGSSATLSTAALLAMDKVMPRVDGALPVDELNKLAMSIKKKYPESETAIIVPDDGTVYEDIIVTMDATREATLDGAGADGIVQLFPKVVVSDMVN